MGIYINTFNVEISQKNGYLCAYIGSDNASGCEIVAKTKMELCQKISEHFFYTINVY